MIFSTEFILKKTFWNKSPAYDFEALNLFLDLKREGSFVVLFQRALLSSIFFKNIFIELVWKIKC